MHVYPKFLGEACRVGAITEVMVNGVKLNLPSVGWSALVDSLSVVVAEEAPCLSEVVALSL